MRGRRTRPHGAALPAEAGAGGCKERGWGGRDGTGVSPGVPALGSGVGVVVAPGDR